MRGGAGPAADMLLPLSVSSVSADLPRPVSETLTSGAGWSGLVLKPRIGQEARVVAGCAISVESLSLVTNIRNCGVVVF